MLIITFYKTQDFVDLHDTIDGLPLFITSHDQDWPLLIKFCQFKPVVNACVSVMCVGICIISFHCIFFKMCIFDSFYLNLIFPKELVRNTQNWKEVKGLWISIFIAFYHWTRNYTLREYIFFRKWLYNTYRSFIIRTIMIGELCRLDPGEKFNDKLVDIFLELVYLIQH